MGIPAEQAKTGAMTETMTPVPAGCVVVGVDGSPGAEVALDWAVEHARLTRRTLALVHGWDTVPSVWLDQVGADAVTLQAEIRAAAAEVVAAAASRVAERAPDLEVLPVVRHEDARALLAGLSAHAEVTVVGSRGRGPAPRHLRGHHEGVGWKDCGGYGRGEWDRSSHGRALGSSRDERCIGRHR